MQIIPKKNIYIPIKGEVKKNTPTRQSLTNNKSIWPFSIIKKAVVNFYLTTAFINKLQGMFQFLTTI